MGGQKFQYDDSGGTFFYFLLSFLALILIPATFYYWPRKRVEDPEKLRKQCCCELCVRKRRIMRNAQPWQKPKNFAIQFTIILGWVALVFIAYKVSQFDYEMANFDPYEILKVSPGASQSEIKKSYRKLSLILHPDKETGNEKEFMKLSKAYQALTDEEARKNWEKYGNPDGPGAMSFGIALPSWIVEKENSVWVLGLYALVFMVAMPIVVGTWWYRSIRFSGDQVLLDTTQMYYFYFHRTPNMVLKRVIMILGASLEFDKKYNSEIVTRPSDDEEVPALLKKLDKLNEKNKERPLCFAYSIKARALIHAHLSRIPLNPETLEKDRQYIVSKCPYLIQEQVNCVNQLILLAYARRVKTLPNIETIENCMKLSPMMTQGMWLYMSPFWQLPYINEDNLRIFMTKKWPIKSLQQLAQMKSEDRRQLLRCFNDDQYNDIMKSLGSMPYIDFQVDVRVMDDENPTEVTAGAIVTVTVTLDRKDMSSLFGDDTVPEVVCDEDGEPRNNSKDDKDKDKEDKDGGGDVEKRPAWMKQKKSAGKKPKKQTKKPRKAKVEDSPAQAQGVPAQPSPAASKDGEATPTEKKKQPKEKEAKDNDETDDTDASEDENVSEDEKNNAHHEDDDDEQWDRIQQKLNRRDKVLEGRSKQSHSVVHCPYFPGDKQEYWWTYICDRKSRTLLTAPCHITSLVDTEEYQLKFTAPRWKGVYTFTVWLRSDSYVGFDQQKDIKLDVKEAPAEITEHPQWDFENSENEEQVEDDGHESEYATDEDLPEDDS